MAFVCVAVYLYFAYSDDFFDQSGFPVVSTSDKVLFPTAPVLEPRAFRVDVNKADILDQNKKIVGETTRGNIFCATSFAGGYAIGNIRDKQKVAVDQNALSWNEIHNYPCSSQSSQYELNIPFAGEALYVADSVMSKVMDFLAVIGLLSLAWYITSDKKYPPGFTRELRRRFPAEDLYFVPSSIGYFRKLIPRRVNPLLLETGRRAWWQSTFKAFPLAPRNEHERKQREQLFWDRYATKWTVVNSARQPALKAKQDIADYFKKSEKWVFREFYAATGIVHETICRKYAALIVDQRSAKEPGEIEKARDALKRFERDDLPAHMEKWGEWFYFHIQGAFKKMATDPKQSPESPTTRRDHPARDHLRYRPNA